MPTPHLGADYLFTERSGSCRGRCDLATYVMRSLGIPVGTNGVLHNPDNSNRHFWSFILNNDGTTSEFTLWEGSPVYGNTKSNWKKEDYSPTIHSVTWPSSPFITRATAPK